jgi:hypothetical protein
MYGNQGGYGTQTPYENQGRYASPLMGDDPLQVMCTGEAGDQSGRMTCRRVTSSATGYSSQTSPTDAYAYPRDSLGNPIRRSEEGMPLADRYDDRATGGLS